jgi:hypothetical protein
MEFVNSHPAACVWAGRALSALVTLALFAIAGQMIFSRSSTKAEFAATGFADSAATPLGILILICAILYAIPQTAVLGALSRCRRKSATGLQLLKFQAAATASRHVLIAAARKVRCVEAEVRWRWTLKVLKTAA